MVVHQSLRGSILYTNYLRCPLLPEAFMECCDPEFSKDTFHSTLQLGYSYTYLTELFEGECHVVLILAPSLASNAVPCTVVSMQVLATELKLIRLIRHRDVGQKLQRDFLAFQEVTFSNNKNILKLHGLLCNPSHNPFIRMNKVKKADNASCW